MFAQLLTVGSACVGALDALQRGGTALQAVEHAIIALEDSECLNAGYGSNLTLEGTAECDASIMDDTGDFGGVGAVSGKVHNLHWEGGSLQIILRSKFTPS